MLAGRFQECHFVALSVETRDAKDRRLPSLRLADRPVVLLRRPDVGSGDLLAHSARKTSSKSLALARFLASSASLLRLVAGGLCCCLPPARPGSSAYMLRASSARSVRISRGPAPAPLVLLRASRAPTKAAPLPPAARGSLVPSSPHPSCRRYATSPDGPQKRQSITDYIRAEVRWRMGSPFCHLAVVADRSAGNHADETRTSSRC